MFIKQGLGQIINVFPQTEETKEVISPLDEVAQEQLEQLKKDVKLPIPEKDKN